MRTSTGIGMGSDSFVSVQVHGELRDRATAGDSFTISRQPAELVLSASSAPTLGSASSGRLPSGSTVFRDFIDRVGDPVPVISEDGTRTPAVQLVVTALGCLVGGPISSLDRVVVAAPAGWSEYAIEELEEELHRRGPEQNRSVIVVPEAIAALAWVARVENLDGYRTVLLCDIGAQFIDLTLATNRGSGFAVVWSSRGIDFSGDHADRLLMGHVLTLVCNAKPDFDVDDPSYRNALVELAARCQVAKERLSQDTSAVVDVELPDFRRQIRVVRSEFEDLIRESLTRAVNMVARELERLEEGGTGVDALVLLGGGSAIPLVTELLSTASGAPIIATAEPDTVSARGAAILADRASSRLADVRSVVPSGSRVLPPAPARPVVSAPARPVVSAPSRPESSAPSRPAVSASSSTTVTSIGKPKSRIRGWLVAASVAVFLLLGAGVTAAQLIGRNDTSPATVTTTTSSVEQASQEGAVNQAPSQQGGGSGGSSSTGGGSSTGGSSSTGGGNGTGGNSGGGGRSGPGTGH